MLNLRKLHLVEWQSVLASFLPVAASVGCLSLDDGSLSTQWAGLAYHWVFVCRRSRRLRCSSRRRLSCRCFLGCRLFFEVFLGGYGDVACAVVRQHVFHNLVDLFLQSVDEVGRVVGLVLYVAQLLLPDTCQLAAFQQFLVDGVDEFDTRRCGNEVFSLSPYVVSLEEGFDDAGTR